MYNVHQHWDRLKVCAVGKSYPPEFYDYIQNKNVRRVLYRIAEETEEDYQLLIDKLNSFNVEIIRSEINPDFQVYLHEDTYIPPPMTPRDYTAMIGDTWYSLTSPTKITQWSELAGSDWPKCPKNQTEFNLLPQFVLNELKNFNVIDYSQLMMYENYDNINSYVEKQGNKIIYGQNISSATCTRIGKDLYFGTENYGDNLITAKENYSTMFPDYRCHIINTGGHADSTFCPVVPGLIVSLYDVPTYKDTFPDWEVIYLPNQSWAAVDRFLQLKKKNKGKWWVPGEEFNDDFTNFVETWMSDWVGYVEETVFDVNMLVIDEKNVICNNYNKLVFDAFDRYGITPHVINFRHRYFWDGGLHCITSDLHRIGTQKDYFPNRD
jgi:hypothetical protein